jgi:hypothetical protein
MGILATQNIHYSILATSIQISTNYLSLSTLFKYYFLNVFFIVKVEGERGRKRGERKFKVHYSKMDGVMKILYFEVSVGRIK